MKKNLLLLLLALAFTGAQAQLVDQVQAFVGTSATTGAQASINVTGLQAGYYKLTFVSSGTVSTCTVKIQDSSDNSSFSDRGVSQTCTSTGAYGLYVTPTSYVRLNITAQTGTGSVLYTLVAVPNTPAAATVTIPNQTLTAPVIAGGLTASGSVANDFSGSTGAFKPSTGTFTFGGVVASTVAANNFDLSADTGTFLSPTGVNTFGGSANNFTNAITVKPVTNQIAVGTTNVTTLSFLSPAGSSTIDVGTSTGSIAVYSPCGANSAACAAAAATANVKYVSGTATLNGASPSVISLTALPFTSSTSYQCTASIEGTTAAAAAAGVAVNKTSGSATTLTSANAGAGLVDFICIGT